MSKYLNEKYEVILYSEFQPMRDVDKPYPREGEMVDHREIVYEFKYYRTGYREMILPKDFIVDLYNQIQEIEKKVVRKRVTSHLPF